jgi:phenylacetate-CoA ligase
MNSHLVREIIFPIGQFIRSEPIVRRLREMERTQWLKPEEIQAIQLEKLKSVIQYAQENIPYYRILFDQSKISWRDMNTLDDMKKFPFLTKEDLRNSADQLRATNYSGGYSKKTTGGSTGQAVSLFKDREATAYLRAAMWRGYRWHGIDFGDRQGRFWGVPITYWAKKKYQFIDFVCNRIRLSAFKVSDVEMLDYYKRLVDFQPRYFYGYVSAIMAFAEFVTRKGLNPNKIGVKTIITTSEVLHDSQRSYIQNTFQCGVRNEYGCGEVGPIAMECPQGRMHVNADNLYVEFLEDEEKKSENVKEVVVTELNSRLMPLIRYKIKDFALDSSEPCPCQRGLPIINGVIGRSYDWIVSEENKYFHGEYFMYLVEEMKRKNMGVRQIQIIQNNKNELNIRIVRDDNFTEKAVDFMKGYFRKDMGENMKLLFEFSENIPREKSGKIRLIVSNVS